MGSSAKESVDVSILANIALVGTYEGLDARLREIDFEWEEDGIKAEGSFYYLAFKDGFPTQQEFAEFLSWKTVPFCLPRSYLRKCYKRFTETRDERYYFEPANRARQLFIKAREKNKKSGEPGEVALFTLLEGFLNAPRIVSKMGLKTNRNIEVFGTDAIHIMFEPQSRTLWVYWGEAKLYQQLPHALDRIALSIKGFREPRQGTGESQRDFDINIIQAHADVEGDAFKEALVTYFDPYSEYSNQVCEVNACLALWDSDLYASLQGLGVADVEKTFRRNYLGCIRTACDLFIKNVREQNLHKLRFHLFLLPLENVKDFRRQFFDKLGIPYEDG